MRRAGLVGLTAEGNELSADVGHRGADRRRVARVFGPGFGATSDEAWTFYGAASDAGSGLRGRVGRRYVDYGMRVLARELAKRQPQTFRFEFAHVGAHTSNPPGHGEDTLYVFGTGDFEARDRAVSERTVGVLQFRRNRRPQRSRRAGLEPYDPARDNYVIFGGTGGEGAGWRTAAVDFIERQYAARATPV